ncbi:MAG: TonB-dependent receptor [Candidatus Solibacter usitatus]|nr:TonB-dependent receptor [Candidatus Solibacter usitatus]
MSKIAFLLLSCFVFETVMTSASAQVLYGTLVGTVSDPSGAVVPKAAIAVKNPATGWSREIVSDDDGRFSLLNVPAGDLEMKVRGTGFRPWSRTAVTVSINTVTRMDVKLEFRGVTEAVTVASSAALLQTDKSDVRSEITATAVTNLPLPNYRNYQSLINLVPGATPADFQNAVVDTPARALTTNINGTARNNNNTLVDGAVNTFIWLPHHTLYVQPVESIENVNITTGSFDAEQGMAGGAAITVATKSGSNQMHGSGFWFHSDQHLYSSAFIKSQTYRKPVEIFNQGGGTIGGPIKKDKLFYFFSFEKTWERNGSFGNYSVPPADWRVGDFSNWKDYALVYDPSTMTNNNPATRQPFANNMIPRNRISPIFDKIQSGAPLPNQKAPTDPFNLSGTYGASGTLMLNRNNYDVKVNWAASKNLMVWGKLSRMDSPVNGQYVFGNLGGPAIGTEGFGDTNVNIPTFGYSYTFSPTMLMDGVFGYSRFDQTVGIPGQDKNVGLDVWGVPGTNGGRQYAKDPRYGGLPLVTGFGFDSWGVAATWAPCFRNDRSYTYQTNFTKIFGSHELRWGFEPRRHEMNHWQPEIGHPRGTITMAGGAIRIPGQNRSISYAAGLLGLVGSYSKSIQFFDMKTREWQHSWYVRDRWQVTRNLTLTLGLRYEYFPLINRGDRGIERWDPYANTVYLGGLGNVPRDVGIEVSKKLLAPRVGFAYRVGTDWVIRSGYGITYDPMPFSRPLRGPYPNTLVGSWNSGTQGALFRESTYGWFNTLAEGIPDVPTPDVKSGTVTLPTSVDFGRSPWGGMINRGYIQSWNFTVQRKLPWDMVSSVGYVGTKTVHQLLQRNINTAGPGVLNSADLPLAKLYGRTIAANMWDGYGPGSYHSLQVSVDKNFSRGLFLKGAYTWSKTLNMADDDGTAGLAIWNWEPWIKRNYAPAGYDRRHMLTMAWMYALPIGKGKRFALSGPLDFILGGWRLNGIFSAYGGTPMTITASGDTLRCQSCGSQTVDLVGPVVKVDNERGPAKPFYDPSAFFDPLWSFNAANPVYRPGTTGRNWLYGPGFWRVDPMISKTFKINERVQTEFRFEAQNGTNTPRWNQPDTGLGQIQRDSSGKVTDYRNFMSITGAGGLRTARLGLRLTF